MVNFSTASYLKQKDGRTNVSLYEMLGDDIYNMHIVRDEVDNNFKAFNTQNDLLTYIKKLPKDKRSLHEVIFGQNPQRIKFDIDAYSKDIKLLDINILPKEYVDMCDGSTKSKANAIITYISDIVVRVFNEKYSKLLSNNGFDNGIRKREHIMITESHGKEKYSFHIILVKFVLPNHKEVGWFSDEVCKNIQPSILEFIDRGVNKSVQNFRILGCCKQSDPSRVKKISVENDSICDNGFIQHNYKDILLNSKNVKISVTGDKSEEITSEMRIICQDYLEKKYPVFKFRCVDKNYLNFNRVGGRSFCDFCDDYHDKEHSLVGIVSDNKLYTICRRNQNNPNHNLRERRLEIELEDTKYDKCKALRKIIESIDDSYDSLQQYHDISDIYDLNKLKDIRKDVDTVYIKAPMKIGKTKALLKHVKSLPADATICILSFRKTFSKQIYKMFPDFMAYNDCVGEITPKQYKRMIIQVESMHRIKDGVYDYVILDESESIINQFANPDMKRKELAFSNFELNIREAKQVICMDAFMSPRTIETIRNMRKKKKEHLSINVHKNASDYKYEVGYCNTYTYNKIKKTLDDGKNVVIMSNHRGILESYKKMLEADRPGLSMIDYTSKTDSQIKNTHMSNVNEHWTDYRVILYTPTITAGISFEEAHFHKVFAIFTNTTCDVLSCIQMMGRIRNVLDRDITICFDLKYKRCSVSLEGIQNDLKYGNYELLSNNNNLGSPAARLKNDRIEYVYNKECNYYKMWLLNELEKNVSKRCFAKHLCECIIQTGAKIEVYDDVIISIDEDDDSRDIRMLDINKRIKDMRKVLSEESIQKIADTPMITYHERRELFEKSEEGETLTEMENNMLEKYNLRKFYEVSEEAVNNVEFIKKYFKREIREQFGNLRHMLLYDSMSEAVEDIRQAEFSKYERIKDNNIQLLDCKFSTDRHSNAVSLLKISGFSHILDQHTVSKEYLVDSYKKHNRLIQQACNVFKRMIPNIRCPSKVDDIDELVFRNQLLATNRILNEMYAYKIEDTRGVGYYKLYPKHKFAIISNPLDMALLDDNVPVLRNGWSDEALLHS